MPTVCITKDQELQAVRDLATRLGEFSYLGPWLDEIACELERAIRGDMPPMLSIGEAQYRERMISERETELKIRWQKLDDCAREQLHAAARLQASAAAQRDAVTTMARSVGMQVTFRPTR